MSFRPVFFLLLFLFSAFAQAQPRDGFAGCMGKASETSYAAFASVRYCLYVYLGGADTTVAHRAVAMLRDEAVRRDNLFLRLLAADAHIGFILARRQPLPVDSILRQRQELAAAAARLADPAYLAWAEQTLANALYSLAHQYDRAFELHLRVHHRLRRLTDAEMPDRRKFLGTIGNHYYEFGEYRQAIQPLAEAVEGGPSPGNNFSDWRQAYNTIGLCYRQLGQYDSSDYFFGEALRLAIGENQRDWVGIARGNLGVNLYRRGRFAEAAPLLQEDLRLSTARGDWDNAAGALLPLADIALGSGRAAEASRMLDTARRYIALENAVSRLPLYHQLRIRTAFAQGDGAAVAAHADSLATIKDTLAQRYSALHLARAEQRLQSAGMRAELAAASAQRRVATLQRNALVAILLLASCAGVFGYLYFRRRRTEAQEKSEAAMRAKDAELHTATTALQRFRQDVQEKSALIEQLSAQLSDDEHAPVLQQLREATILTDAQWTEFRRMFEQVHGGFIARLSQQHPGLSPAELRFLVLARLGFSTKEMAGALGISASSVRVIWHRVRRKLGLDEEAPVSAFVEAI